VPFGDVADGFTQWEVTMAEALSAAPGTRQRSTGAAMSAFYPVLGAMKLSLAERYTTGHAK
jgi:hypothetical protein